MTKFTSRRIHMLCMKFKLRTRHSVQQRCARTHPVIGEDCECYRHVQTMLRTHSPSYRRGLWVLPTRGNHLHFSIIPLIEEF